MGNCWCADSSCPSHDMLSCIVHLTLKDSIMQDGGNSLEVKEMTRVFKF